MEHLKKAVFFDFAGTLMDHESDMRAHEAMLHILCDRYGIEESAERMMDPLHDFIRLFNLYTPSSKTDKKRERIRTAFGEYMSRYGIQPGEEDLLWFRQIYLDKHNQHIYLYPEAQEVLRTVWGTGLHVGLISDIDIDFIQDQLTRLAIKDYFDSVTTSEEASVWKPDPRVFEIALSKAGCRGEESIHVGDNLERDVVGANRMNMTTIWYPNSRDAYSDAPDYTISNLKDIVPIVRAFGVDVDSFRR